MTSDDRKTGTEPVPPLKKGGGNGSAKSAEEKEKDEPTKNEGATSSDVASEATTRSREITKRRA